MKDDGEARLTECVDRTGLAEGTGAGWNQEVLAIGGVHGSCDQTVDWTCEGSIEPIGEDGFDDGAFGDAIGRDSWVGYGYGRHDPRGGRRCRGSCGRCGHYRWRR